MLNPNDIKNYSGLSKAKQQAFEKQMQEDELHYLSSVSFEEFNVSEQELEALTKHINQSSTRNFKLFQTIFISLLCGLLIGVSIFFIIFHKNQNHPSVWQIFESKEDVAPKSLNNSINPNDTLFPTVEQKAEVIEHFHSNENQIQEIKIVETPDMLSTLSTSLSLENGNEDNDIVLQFIPNAPVIFIHQLKVTNYKGYYFKQNQSIDLAELSGVAAQYESAANKEIVQLNRSNAYLANKIIQNAMRLFNGKKYANCIEELMLLYNYNKDDANAQFYLGMCFYLTKKYSVAQNYFQQNLDNQNNIFHQESEFYQALCLLNTNQKDQAISQLKQIVTNKGFYSTRAQEVLDKEK